MAIATKWTPQNASNYINDWVGNGDVPSDLKAPLGSFFRNYLTGTQWRQTDANQNTPNWQIWEPISSSGSTGSTFVHWSEDVNGNFVPDLTSHNHNIGNSSKRIAGVFMASTINTLSGLTHAINNGASNKETNYDSTAFRIVDVSLNSGKTALVNHVYAASSHTFADVVYADNLVGYLNLVKNSDGSAKFSSPSNLIIFNANIRANSLSATTLSGGTIYSGSTELSTIITNIAGTAENPATGLTFTYDVNTNLTGSTKGTIAGNIVNKYTYKNDNTNRLDFYTILKGGVTKKYSPVYTPSSSTTITSITIVTL